MAWHRRDGLCHEGPEACAVADVAPIEVVVYQRCDATTTAAGSRLQCDLAHAHTGPHQAADSGPGRPARIFHWSS